MSKLLQAGIFMFDGVEVLDFAGPYEVFSLTGVFQEVSGGTAGIKVATFSETGKPTAARNGLRIVPDYGFHTAPEFDIIVIPGGPGILAQYDNDTVKAWLQDKVKKAQIIASVCTGAFLLAKAGLLDGKRATTQWDSIEELRTRFSGTTVVSDARFVDEGQVITSAGVSAGIDMSLHIVKRFFGDETARSVARIMEYDVTLRDE